MYGEAPELEIRTEEVIGRQGKENKQNPPSSRKTVKFGRFYGI